MGTWGVGNFDDDSALDYLALDIVQPLVDKISSESATHDESNGEEIMVAAEVLAILCEQCGAVPPVPDDIALWRKAYLQAWDGYIDGLDPKPAYKEDRRAVISRTFDRLLAVSHKWHDRPV